MSSSDWLEMTIFDVSDRDAVTAALFAHNCGGIHDTGSKLLAFFPGDADVEFIRSIVERVDNGARLSVRAADAPDPQQYHGKFSPISVGALIIAPPWLANNSDASRTIVIEPAMAFGTGDHPTTRGVLRLLQSIKLTDKKVADLGAGSAVLSIAAARLGANRVVAIEIDPDSAGNAAENIEANGVADRVHFLIGDARTLLPLIAPVDVILANILSSVVIDLLPIVRDSLSKHGHAILSGILNDESSSVKQAFEAAGFVQISEDIEGEWWSVLINHA